MEERLRTCNSAGLPVGQDRGSVVSRLVGGDTEVNLSDDDVVSADMPELKGPGGEGETTTGMKGRVLEHDTDFGNEDGSEERCIRFSDIEPRNFMKMLRNPSYQSLGEYGACVVNICRMVDALCIQMNKHPVDFGLDVTTLLFNRGYYLEYCKFLPPIYPGEEVPSLYEVVPEDDSPPIPIRDSSGNIVNSEECIALRMAYRRTLDELFKEVKEEQNDMVILEGPPKKKPKKDIGAVEDGELPEDRSIPVAQTHEEQVIKGPDLQRTIEEDQLQAPTQQLEPINWRFERWQSQNQGQNQGQNQNRTTAGHHVGNYKPQTQSVTASQQVTNPPPYVAIQNTYGGAWPSSYVHNSVPTYGPYTGMVATKSGTPGYNVSHTSYRAQQVQPVHTGNGGYGEGRYTTGGYGSYNNAVQQPSVYVPWGQSSVYNSGGGAYTPQQQANQYSNYSHERDANNPYGMGYHMGEGRATRDGPVSGGATPSSEARRWRGVELIED